MPVAGDDGGVGFKVYTAFQGRVRFYVWLFGAEAGAYGDATLDAAEIAAAEATPAGPLDLLPKLLPELTLTLAALVLAVSPDRYGPRVRDALTAVVLVEIFFCLGQATTIQPSAVGKFWNGTSDGCAERERRSGSKPPLRCHTAG